MSLKGPRIQLATAVRGGHCHGVYQACQGRRNGFAADPQHLWFAPMAQSVKLQGKTRHFHTRQRFLDAAQALYGGGSQKCQSDVQIVGVYRAPGSRRKPNMVIVRVKPTFVTIGGSDVTPSLDFIDLEKEISYSEEWACYKSK